MPRQLVALFGMPEEGLNWKLAWAWAATLAVCIFILFRQALDWINARQAQPEGTKPKRIGHTALGLLLFGGTWLAIYCVVRFQVYDPPAPEIAYPGSTRYAAPIYPMCFFAIALVAGIAWKKKPILFVAVLLFPMITGLQARIHAFSTPFPTASLAGLEPVDWEFFRPQFELRYEGEDGIALLDRCETEDTRTLELHAYSRGRSRTAEILRDPDGIRTLSELVPPTHAQALHWWEGVGEAIEMHHRNDGDVLLILRNAYELLTIIPDENDAGRARALYAIALQSMNKDDPWIVARRSHDDEAIRQIHDFLAPLEVPIANAAWRAHGREWAKTIAGFYSMSQIHLPTQVSIAPPAFFSGIGQGLGERWGPADEIPSPDALPPHGESALRQGYQMGVSVRWIDAENQGLPLLIRQ